MQTKPTKNLKKLLSNGLTIRCIIPQIYLDILSTKITWSSFLYANLEKISDSRCRQNIHAFVIIIINMCSHT